MPVGLLCAVGTAFCYGLGSVLQAAAAGDAEPVDRLDPRLLMTLARTWRYPLGLALDGAGFLLSLVALVSWPLYAVQSVVSGFLAVTAVAGVVLLGLRLQRREVAAVLAVVLGLTVVGLSAAPGPARGLADPTQWSLLAVAVALSAASFRLGRLTAGGAWGLGATAGVAFGVVAVAARGLADAAAGGTPGADLRALAEAPASYALLVAAPLGLTAYATALQRGSVVQATAPLVVAETVVPALAGLALLGDHARPGWEVPAALGFALAVGAALLLPRFGEVEAGAADRVLCEPVGPHQARLRDQR